MSNWVSNDLKELRNFSGSHEVHPILSSNEDNGSTKKKISSRCSKEETRNWEHVSFEEPSKLPSGCGDKNTYRTNGEGKFITKDTLFLH